jgi:hypothetical protein
MHNFTNTGIFYAIFSVKKIGVGDEITYDYGKDYFDYYIKPYGCKCASCVAKREKQKLKDKEGK